MGHKLASIWKWLVMGTAPQRMTIWPVGGTETQDGRSSAFSCSADRKTKVSSHISTCTWPDFIQEEQAPAC